MITLLFALSFSHPAAAEPARLTLGAYLDQVARRSPGAIAARLHSSGGVSRAEGASVLTFPYLFGSASMVDEKAQAAMPAFQGTETKANAFTVGAGINTPFGLSGKYSWNSGYAHTVGLQFPTIGDYTSFNKLELTLNLVRNGFGSEISARQKLIRSGNSAQSLSGDYQLVATLSQAEAVYWRLAFARQTVQVQRDVLARAAKLLEWAKRRVSLQLGDRSDLLQAQASHDLHRLDLSTAQEEERASARAFNSLRDIDSETVSEAVGVPSLPDTLEVSAPARSGERLDVQAAAEKTKAAQAQSQLDKEQLKPNVDISATYAWNGRNVGRDDAISDAFGSRHPTRSIALVFSVPLDVPTWRRAIRGADQEIEAAGYELDQTRLAEAREWNDLSAHLAQARSRQIGRAHV